MYVMIKANIAQLCMWASGNYCRRLDLVITLAHRAIGLSATPCHFLTDRTHFVRLQGGVSLDSPVLSGVPQGTVLGPLLFIILMCDINHGLSCSSIVSFADDTRLYHGISSFDDCTILQNDLNSVYDWASCNKIICLNAQKFKYICFSNF